MSLFLKSIFIFCVCFSWANASNVVCRAQFQENKLSLTEKLQTLVDAYKNSNTDKLDFNIPIQLAKPSLNHLSKSLAKQKQILDSELKILNYLVAVLKIRQQMLDFKKQNPKASEEQINELAIRLYANLQVLPLWTHKRIQTLQSNLQKRVKILKEQDFISYYEWIQFIKDYSQFKSVFHIAEYAVYGKSSLLIGQYRRLEALQIRVLMQQASGYVEFLQLKSEQFLTEDESKQALQNFLNDRVPLKNQQYMLMLPTPQLVSSENLLLMLAHYTHPAGVYNKMSTVDGVFYSEYGVLDHDYSHSFFLTYYARERKFSVEQNLNYLNFVNENLLKKVSDREKFFIIQIILFLSHEYFFESSSLYTQYDSDSINLGLRPDLFIMVFKRSTSLGQDFTKLFINSFLERHTDPNDLGRKEYLDATYQETYNALNKVLNTSRDWLKTQGINI